MLEWIFRFIIWLLVLFLLWHQGGGWVAVGLMGGAFFAFVVFPRDEGGPLE